MKQLELFNPLKYDVRIIFCKQLFKTSPLSWDVEKIQNLPKRFLRIIAIKFRLPYSGTKAKILSKILAFIDLAKLVKDNFNQDEDRELTIKDKPPSTLKLIKPVLKNLCIRHSWLPKRGKLQLAKKIFVDCWLFKPNWSKYSF